MKAGINTIEEWCTTNMMQCNKTKSFIIFIPRQQRGRKTRYTGEINGIKIVKSAKYLGIILDKDLQFKEQIDEWKSKI